MVTRTRSPKYEDVVRARVGIGKPLHRVTQQIIALEPGDVLRVTPPDGDVRAERRRLSSRLRTAALVTHRRYHTTTVNGRLYVACEEDQ